MGVAEALRMMNAGLDYLNGPGLPTSWTPPGAASVLRSLGEIAGEVHRRARRGAGPVRRR